MKIAIRTDASLYMGTGHLMRCLTLAGEVRQQGHTVTFICRELPGNLCELIEKKGYHVYRLPFQDKDKNRIQTVQDVSSWLGATWREDAEQTISVLQEISIASKIDWLVVDHYALDIQWERMMRPYVKRIMVIDDLANRRHDCDLLLDQNLYENMEQRYMGLVPETCKLLLGPQYALLRPEFREARKKLRPRDGTVRRILIFFGGSDPTNETLKAIEAVKLLNRPDIEVDVVVGANNPHRCLIKEKCAAMPNFYFHCQVDNMAELMVKADLAIGAGGSTTWERCFLGLPSLVIVIADNQFETTSFLAQKGCIYYLGRSAKVNVSDINVVLMKLLQAPSLLKEMAYNALSIMGVTENLVFVLKEYNNSYRDV